MFAFAIIFALCLLSLFFWLPFAFLLKVISWAFPVLFTWKRAWAIAYTFSFLLCLSTSKSK